MSALAAEIESPVAFDLLERFTSPTRSEFSRVMACWHYRGDLTQSGDERLRRGMGEGRYEHYHWDTVACSGGVLLRVPRFKHPLAVERKTGLNLPAPYYWCLDQVETDEDCAPAKDRLLRRVVRSTMEQLRPLPALEFVEVTKVNYWQHGRGPAKRKSQKAPCGIGFFRFTGGVGCVALSEEAS